MEEKSADRIHRFLHEVHGIASFIFFTTLLFLLFVLSFILICLLFPILFIFRIFTVLFSYIFNSTILIPYQFSVPNCDRFESSLIHECLKEFTLDSSLCVENRWTNLMMKSRKVQFHSIVCSPYSHCSNSKPTLIWIHGFGGSAVMSFIASGVIQHIYHDYNVHAIDLPEDEVIDFFVESLKAYLLHSGIISSGPSDNSPLLLAGHSFGGFVALNFAHKYPEYITKLLLVSAAGIFPTTGIPTGGSVISSLLFRMGFPISQLRALGWPGLCVYYGCSELLCSLRLWLCGEPGIQSERESTDQPVKTRSDPSPSSRSFLSHGSVMRGSILKQFWLNLYWYQVQASPLGLSDHLLARFISFSPTSIKWTRPALSAFLHLKVPVSLAYGDSDPLIPPHQGLVLSLLSGSRVPLFFLHQSGHGPMHKSQGKDFATMLKRAFLLAAPVSTEENKPFLQTFPSVFAPPRLLSSQSRGQSSPANISDRSPNSLKPFLPYSNPFSPFSLFRHIHLFLSPTPHTTTTPDSSPSLSQPPLERPPSSSPLFQIQTDWKPLFLLHDHNESIKQKKKKKNDQSEKEDRENEERGSESHCPSGNNKSSSAVSSHHRIDFSLSFSEKLSNKSLNLMYHSLLSLKRGNLVQPVPPITSISTSPSSSSSPSASHPDAPAPPLSLPPLFLVQGDIVQPLSSLPPSIILVVKESVLYHLSTKGD